MIKQLKPIEGQATNSDKARRKVFKNKPIDMTGKSYQLDTSYPVKTWVLRKKFI